MDGDLILEDITTGKTFLLEKDSQPISCGRSKLSQIFTPSLLASRTHCVFARNPSGLNVLDMGGANGIYVNGIHQKETRIPLKINDLIGLGCPDLEPSPSPIKTIYRLKLAEPKKETNDPFSAEHTAVELQTSTKSTASKRKNSKNSVDRILPIKKIKTDVSAAIVAVIDITEDSNDSNDVVPGDWNKPHTSFTNPFAQANLSVIKFDTPAEASTSRENDASARLVNGNDPSLATVKSTSDLHNETIKSQDKDKGHSRDKSRDTKTDEQRSSVTTKKRKSSNDTDSRGEDGSKEPKKSFALPVDPPSTLVEHSHPATLSTEQAIASRRPSTDSSSGEEIDILRREGLLDLSDDESSHSSWENVEDFSIPGYNADDAELQKEMKIGVPTSDDVEQAIKYEPEYHIIDNDESLYMDVNHSSQSLTPTPLKLKRVVKPEPITSYSQFDVVALSDDEDDVFPASQLFGDDEGIENESKVKIENEMGDDNDENETEMFDRRRNDSPELIDLSDSEEEEDNPWYQRLLRAELNASRESVIQTLQRTKIEKAALKVPGEANSPMYPPEEAPMSPLEEAPMSLPEEAPMSPPEEASMSPPEKTTSTLLPQQTESTFLLQETESTFLPQASTSTLHPRETTSTFLPRETTSTFLSRETSPMSPEADIPISPLTEAPIDEDSESMDDIAAEIHELCFATDKNKTEKTATHENKDKRKKHRTKNLEKPKKLAVEPMMKKVVQENSSSNDDSMSNAKSSDNTKHKNKSHHRDKYQSIDRSADSDDTDVKGTKKSKSRKHDGDKRRYSSDAKGDGTTGSSTSKRDSTEEKSNLRTKTAHIADSSNKKRDSTEEKSSVRTKIYSSADNRNKNRHSTEEELNHRTEPDPIADIRNDKRDSTKETSNDRMETDRIADIRNNKRDSAKEKSKLQTRIDNIADIRKKERDSTDETFGIRTKIDSTGDNWNKKRDSTERTSHIQTKTDSVDGNRIKKHDSTEEKSARRTETASVVSNNDNTGNNKQHSMEEKTKYRAETFVRSNNAIPVLILTKVDQVRKSVPIVEAPIIGNNQRRGVSCNVKVIDRSSGKPESHTLPTSGARPHVTNNTKLSPPKERKLPTQERKELEYSHRIQEKRRMKEQKFRRMTNKWADCLPPRKRIPSPVMTREARDVVRHDRKEKLKQIADKEKELAEANAAPPKRVTVKAKAKVTQRTRNDFLVEQLKDQFAKESANIDRTTVDNTNEVSDVQKRNETTTNHSLPSANGSNFGHNKSADNKRTTVENREKTVDGKKRKSKSSNLRREMTTNEEIPPINTLYLDKNNSDQESENSLSDLGTESTTYGDAYPINEPTSPMEKNRQDKSSDLREEITTNGEINLINGANFYRENNEQESEVLPSQSEKKSTANGAAPLVNGVKSPKGKKKKINSLDSGKENAMNGETRVANGADSFNNVIRNVNIIVALTREELIYNRHVEKSMIQTGVPRAGTLQNGTARVLEESDLVGGQTLNNNVIYEKESTIASRDPRIKAGKPVKLKSLLKQSHGTTASKPRIIKRVSFDDLNTKVLLFEINPGNILRKCDFKGKDSLSLIKNPSKGHYAVTTNCPKLENFLLRIFEWNPVWLKEQKFMPNMPPPIVNQKELVPMIPKYDTYHDYYKAVEPLMALELWHGITKDFDNGTVAQNNSMFSVVQNSVTRTIVPSSNIRVTTLMIEILVSKQTLQSRSYPVCGDLIFFEYVSNIRDKKGGFQRWKVFAYVTKLHQSIVGPHTYFNDGLRKFVLNPYMLLTLTVMTKPLNPIEMQTNTINRLGKISYLRSNIRTIEALQYLPASPLLKMILNPKVEDYQLPHVGNLESYPLVTKDNLNAKQLEAVARVTEAVVQKLPKICLIQGPPGTGKSKVIVNIITQILYGRAKHPNKKPMRILVCAPSNAAIDEIVLRLLDIRRTFPKGNRFNMVRIGRDDAMHPSVKEVSLTELAKRNVKSITDIYRSPDFSAECVEEEKHRLEARKNSLDLELTTSQNLDPVRIKQIMNKLEDVQANYDLLMNRRSAKNLDSRETLRLLRASENTLLKGADVIASTLTSCYTGTMESIFVGHDATISVCIVDEATQSIEAETFLPLMLGVKTLVLVGDRNQLPAVILSQQAKKLGLDQSLFARVQQSFDGHENNPIILLDTQYRMSYPVAYWPNRYFYAGALKNSESLRNLPSNFYKVINLDSTQDINKFTNTKEAHFVANLVYTLMARSNWDNTQTQVRIGIITPYNDQKTLVTKTIKERIAMLPDKTKKKFIHEVNTVDSFQGQERDIIIMCCVRSNGIGFLSDRQRLCVALTRAKNSLIICGNFATFKRNPMWNALLSDAKGRGVYLNLRSTSEVDVITKNIFT